MTWRNVARQIRRSEIQWTLVPIMAAAALSFLPGFNVLSFYFCLPMGLLLAMSSGSVVITAVSRERGRGGSPITGARHGMMHAAMLPLGPLAVITVAHFVNGPCDYWFGLGHYAAGPVMSSLIGGAVAAACSLALVRERRASAAFIIVFVASFLPDAAILYFQPSVQFFNPFLGYYPGPIYDELIEVTPAFVAFRVWCVVAAAALCMTIALIFDDGRGWPGPRALLRRTWVWIPALLLWAATGLLWEGWGEYRFHIDRDDIRQELSITKSDRYCTIYADASYVDRPETVDLLLKDCGFRHRQMAAFFDVPADRPIIVYLYRDSEQKARLIGARWAEISKPWLAEVHVTDMNPGDMVLGHEVAHVVAGRLARNLLALPLQAGVIPDMGMVEGLAVAAAFADEGPSPHEWALAMLGAGIKPDVNALFSPFSFITGGAAASYNTAGSFIRFIRERHGGRAVRLLASGESFKDATGKTIAELDGEWLAYLKSAHSGNVDDVLKTRAAARFADPGVLFRKCPIDVARNLRDAVTAYDGGNLAGALAAVRKASCVDSGDRSLKRLEARLAARIARDPTSFSTVVEDVLRPPEGAASMSDRTAAADIMMLFALENPSDPHSSEFLERSFVELRDLRAMLASGGALRGICARLTALDSDPESGLAIVTALSDPRPWAEGDYRTLAEVADRYPGNAVLQYLAGRAAISEADFKGAARLFSTALDAGFREPRGSFAPDMTTAGPCVSDFTAEAWKQLGISAYWSRDSRTALSALTTARRLARFEGDRMLIDEYLSRPALPQKQ